MEASSPRTTPRASHTDLVEWARRLLHEGSPPALQRLPDLAVLLDSADPPDAVLAARVAGLAAAAHDGALAEAARKLLRRTAVKGSHPAARRSLQCLASTDRPENYRPILERALSAWPDLLDDETVAILAGQSLDRAMVEVFVGLAEESLLRGDQPAATEGLVRFIVAFGATHPSWYRRLRHVLTRGLLMAPDAALQESAAFARDELERAFRRWLGPVSHIAVARETGEEYGWDDVVTFDDAVPAADRHRLLVAIKHSPLLREAILLLYEGTTLELGHVLPGAIRIQHIGRRHGRSVYRLTVQDRGGARYELALKLAPDQPPTDLRAETDWLILCGDGEAAPVSARLGGYWPALHLWTGELIHGDNLAHTLQRLSLRDGESERFAGFWPFAAWSAMGAFISFWDRTGRRLIVEDPSPENVVVPLHDYHAPARLVSIAHRAPCSSPACVLGTLRTQFVEATEARYPRLTGLVSWETVFSALLGAVGERPGLELLQAAREELPAAAVSLLDPYLETVGRRGFLPLRLYFAVKRYQRWTRLNPEATAEARARTVRDLYATYDLEALQETRPETRVRFFRETVLNGVGPGLAKALEDLIQRLRTGPLTAGGLEEAATGLRNLAANDGPETAFFLGHLFPPHPQSRDRRGFTAAPGAGIVTSDVVVTVRDGAGVFFRIRHALSRREVEALRHLFATEKLPVCFNDTHRFLLAVAETGRVAGGLFYELDPEGRVAHMDKVIVDRAFRGRGLAAALMEELTNRLLAMDIDTLTTGFFRPQFFHRHGFRIDPHHAGLVKDLRAGHPVRHE